MPRGMGLARYWGVEETAMNKQLCSWVTCLLLGLASSPALAQQDNGKAFSLLNQYCSGGRCISVAPAGTYDGQAIFHAKFTGAASSRHYLISMTRLAGGFTYLVRMPQSMVQRFPTNTQTSYPGRPQQPQSCFSGG
jgi:hypothetical protein